MVVVHLARLGAVSASLMVSMPVRMNAVIAAEGDAMMKSGDATRWFDRACGGKCDAAGESSSDTHSPDCSTPSRIFQTHPPPIFGTSSLWWQNGPDVRAKTHPHPPTLSPSRLCGIGEGVGDGSSALSLLGVVVGGGGEAGSFTLPHRLPADPVLPCAGSRRDPVRSARTSCHQPAGGHRRQWSSCRTS